MPRPMTIHLLAVDKATRSPIVILKELNGERMLPIWIGPLEAQAITSELGGIKSSRPMTHDLLKSIIEETGIRVNRVEICDLKDDTYYSVISLTYKGKAFSIDARPSDALALSLRVGAPIFVKDEVIEKFEQFDLQVEPEDKSERGKRWREILEKLDPEDFGNT